MTELPDYADLPPAPHGGRSAWGLFGAGDNLGLVNLITAERIAAAARLVRRGRVFCLDMPLAASPRHWPRSRRATSSCCTPASPPGTSASHAR